MIAQLRIPASTWENAGINKAETLERAMECLSASPLSSIGERGLTTADRPAFMTLSIRNRGEDDQCACLSVDAVYEITDNPAAGPGTVTREELNQLAEEHSGFGAEGGLSAGTRLALFDRALDLG